MLFSIINEESLKDDNDFLKFTLERHTSLDFQQYNEVVNMINNNYIKVATNPIRRNPYLYDDDYDYDNNEDYGSDEDFDDDPYGRSMFPDGPEGDDMLEEWFSDADD